MLAACRQFAWLGFLAVSSGCAMCNNCDDQSYPAYGGAWERLDPNYGRVGSAFTPEVGARRLATKGDLGDESSPSAEELPRANPVPPDDLPPQPPAAANNKSTDSSVLLGPIRTTR